ncbi:50S ribosomal protein L14e [Candidatus Woesearchaeota archaeon]|nr:50S ribosomal protein L14e [Candidatus Woesearchaeota archaeon]
MYSIGRICVKTAGRDAGMVCVVVEAVDKDYVVIDGQTRRRKCNIDHLEATAKTVELKAGAGNKEVVDALKKAGFAVSEKKPGSRKKAAERPKKQKKSKARPSDEKQEKKKASTKPQANPKAAVEKPAEKEEKKEGKESA